ncbi:hypothetical protein [Bacteroides gallinarum]|uniref:hypothetical protein n=1 Tax=Bacteroides gallinarum TaxID=376806 RepID=UPI00037B4D73|nr:hypothetical protein [Bacteroides gallinarum]
MRLIFLSVLVLIVVAIHILAAVFPGVRNYIVNRKIVYICFTGLHIAAFLQISRYLFVEKWHMAVYGEILTLIVPLITLFFLSKFSKIK